MSVIRNNAFNMKAKNFQKEELGEPDFEQLVIETVATVFLPGDIVTFLFQIGLYAKKPMGKDGRIIV